MPPRSAWCWQSSRPCDYLPATPPWAGQGASRGLANWWLRVRPTSSRIGCVRAEWKFCASSTPPGSGRQICESRYSRSVHWLAAFFYRRRTSNSRNVAADNAEKRINRGDKTAFQANEPDDYEPAVRFERKFGQQVWVRRHQRRAVPAHSAAGREDRVLRRVGRRGCAERRRRQSSWRHSKDPHVRYLRPATTPYGRNGLSGELVFYACGYIFRAKSLSQSAPATLQ